MKYNLFIFSILATLFFVNCSSRESKPNSQNSAYDVLYKDSFDILLHNNT